MTEINPVLQKQLSTRSRPASGGKSNLPVTTPDELQRAIELLDCQRRLCEGR